MYEKMGGIDVISRLVDEFYFIMSTDPNAKECFATHSGKDLKESAEKLKAFLSGWTGGPPLYLDKYGHPRLRMRHFPFAISDVEAKQWLYCMQKALATLNIPAETQNELMSAFTQVALMVRNKN